MALEELLHAGKRMRAGAVLRGLPERGSESELLHQGG